MEMRELFSNSGAEINKKGIVALAFLSSVFVQSRMNIFKASVCFLKWRW